MVVVVVVLCWVGLGWVGVESCSSSSSRRRYG